jgi:hypothetical protein
MSWSDTCNAALSKDSQALFAETYAYGGVLVSTHLAFPSPCLLRNRNGLF